MFVLGTAGHIDHGKSTLVKALTGIDPDRLKEEKERSMTIDLGFAWLKLPSGREVGVVDVPGHERFIKNMLAGVGGIDLALLIVAANEGVQEQTREHLAIIDLLEIKKGVVALTKKDTVDDEWLSLVKMEVEELLKPTTLAGAPMVAVSANTGEGLDELKSTIDRLLSTTEPRKDLGRPRLPIDRIFTITGSGTIVTGTLIDGPLNVGDEVEIVPKSLKARIRGLQTHKEKLNSVKPGSRVAANLVGVTMSELQRGDVVTKPGWLSGTQLVSVRLRMLPYLRYNLKNNSEVALFSGSAETPGKIRLLEAEQVKPGENTWAQILLDKPIAVVNGDHYIIRSTNDTLGGGKIVEAHAQRLRRLQASLVDRLRAKEEGTADEALLALLETRQPQGKTALKQQSKLPEEEFEETVRGLVEQGRIVGLGEGETSVLMTAKGWEQIRLLAVAATQEYHKKFPLRNGIPRVELSNKLKAGSNTALVLARLISDGVLVEEGLTLRLQSHKIQLSPAQQAKIKAFLESLEKDPYSPPGELVPEPELVNLLAEQGKVVKVSESVVFSPWAYKDMVTKVTSRLKDGSKITLGEVRDMFQTSRKYAQALLEHLDGEKITRRVGDERVLY